MKKTLTISKKGTRRGLNQSEFSPPYYFKYMWNKYSTHNNYFEHNKYGSTF